MASVSLPNGMASRLKSFSEELSVFDEYLVISHHDADGITSCSITVDFLESLGRSVDYFCLKQIDSFTVKKIRDYGGATVVFTDFGSGHHSLLEEHGVKDYFVIDHHPPEREYARQMNPHDFGVDGGSDISGAGMAYLVARSLGRKEMAHLAVVGAVGDMQDSRGALESLNRLILSDAVGSGTIQVENDIRMFGRQSRTLTQMLAYSSDPIIPGITGDQSACANFLSSQNIELTDGESYRSYVDLSPDERQRLITGLYMKLIDDRTPDHVIDRMFGEVYTLLLEPHRSELRDAKEFATVLNACGRQKQPDIGVRVCLGDRGLHWNMARQLLEAHRRQLAEGLEFLSDAGVTELSNLSFFDAQDKIKESIIGIIAGMAYGANLIPRDRPILAFAQDLDDPEYFKVSSRANWELVRRGIRLGKALSQCSREFGGEGGGHDIAAGARAPKKHMMEFIESVNETFKKQLA
jgi:single-stranded-DNA-specific exonuclease